MNKENPLPIIIVGANGRMGREITRLVRDNQNYRLAGLVDLPDHLPQVDAEGCIISGSLPHVADNAPNSVIIDFTSAANTLRTAAVAGEKNMPLVTGSTGFTEDQKMELAALASVTPILWSANMSIGINVLLRILPALAAALGPDYDMEITELHHKNKKDAPSGTALMLGEVLAKARGWDLEKTRVSARNGKECLRGKEEIGIQAIRGGDAPGIHNIYFLGSGEFIEVTHQAESRENFARGALRAARWLKGRQPGPLYSMADVIWPEARM